MIRQSIIDFTFAETIVVVVIDADKSIINSTENIEYFDFEYEDFFDKNSFIMNFNRYIYYRDIYVFIDRLKNLKQNLFDFKIKKYVFACLKNNAFT